MKKFTIILILIKIPLTFLYGQTCDRYFETTITYDNDSLDLHYDNTSMGNYFKIYHRDPAPGETINTDLSVIDIKKPIIIIEGYDIFFDESCDRIYNHYINYGGLGNNLRADGYDIITYNLSAPMVAIQLNALIFANFIDSINRSKSGEEELR